MRPAGKRWTRSTGSNRRADCYARAVLRRLGLLTLFTALAAAGCGGGGGDGNIGHFDIADIGVTFEYPLDTFDISSQIKFQSTAGAEPQARAAIVLDNDNAITVSKYALRISVSKSNLATVKSEVDKVIGQLARKPVSGREVEYGGLPGYEYVIDLTTPASGQSRMVVLFDDRVEYLFNCQSTPPSRDVIEAACSGALDTLATK
jgi:hypothetical protein